MHTSKFTDAKDMKYLQIIKVYQSPCSQLIVKGCSRSWLPCSRIDVSLAGGCLQSKVNVVSKAKTESDLIDLGGTCFLVAALRVPPCVCYSGGNGLQHG